MGRVLLPSAAVLVLVAACSGDPVTQRDEYYRSAQEYLAAGKLDEASIQFLNAIKVDQGFVPARLGLVDVLERTGRVQNAAAELRKILEIDKNNKQARLRLGRYFLLAGTQEPSLFEEARKMAEEVLALDPDDAEALILLGNSYAGQQNFEKSIEALQKVLESDPNNLQAHINLGAARFGARQPKEAEQAFLDAVARNPESTVALLALGHFYGTSGDLTKAEESFRRAFELNPGDQQAVLALVRLYLAQQKPDQARGVFQQAIAAGKDPAGFQMGLASLELGLGRPDVAEQIIQKLKAERPNDSVITLRLAELHLAMGKTEEAAAGAEEVLRREPNHVDALLLKSRVMAGQGEIEAALPLLDRAVGQRPNLIPAWVLKVDLLQRKGDLPAAEQAARKGLESDRTNTALRARLAKLTAVMKRNATELQNALTEAETILAQEPENADALVAKAEAELGMNRLADARADFGRLNELSPRNPFYRHRLGTVSVLQKKYDEALRWFRGALEIDPNLPDVANDLVVSLIQQGKKAEALAEIDRMEAAASVKTHLVLLRGKVLLANGDYAGAEAEFRRAQGMDPDNYESYLFLGQVQMQQNRVDQAIKEVDGLLAKNPNFAPAHLLRAWFFDASKNQAGAVGAYRKCLELFAETDPGYAVAANNLAWLLAESGGDLAEARSLAERARARDPNNAQFADTLGWIYYKMGNYTLAVDQLLQSVNQGNQQPQHYYRLGMAYYRKGDFNHARQSLRRALELGQDFPGVDEARRTLSELG
jgi:tetratricopeptide (TPR) repeat protein